VADDVPTDERYRRYLLAVLTAAYVLSYLDRQILSILLESIKHDLTLSDTAMGLLSGPAFAVCYAVCGLPLGALADVRSRPKILAACLVVWSGATALCGLAATFAHLFVARVAVGVGEAGCIPTAQSLIASHFPPERRGAAFGVFLAGTAIGTCLGFLVGGWLNAEFGWRTAFVVVGLPGLLLAAVVYRTILEFRTSARLSARGAATWRQLRGAAAALRRQSSFWRVAVSAGLAAIVSYGLGAWLASFFIRYHQLGTTQVGMLLAFVFGIGGGVGVLVAGRLGDRWGRRDPAAYTRLAALACTAAVPLFWFALLTPDLTTAVVALTPAVMLTQSIAAPAYAAIHGVLPSEHRAFGTSAFMFVGNLLGIGCGALLVGMLSDHLVASAGGDALRWALLAVVACAVPAGVGFALAGPALRAEWRTSPGTGDS
jgi:predicted MFS family arabinose efflux permease